MNSCRLGVHFWPTRVRKSIAYSHSPKVRSVLRTNSCNDLVNSSIRNLTRGFFTSSKLRMTAAVSSVSLNWGIFALSLGGYVCLRSIYTSGQAKVSRGVECRADFGYLHSVLVFQE